jgi:hypothetical protein
MHLKFITKYIVSFSDRSFYVAGFRAVHSLVIILDRSCFLDSECLKNRSTILLPVINDCPNHNTKRKQDHSFSS